MKNKLLTSIVLTILSVSVHAAHHVSATVFLSCEAICGERENIYMYSGESIDNHKASIEARIKSMHQELQDQCHLEFLDFKCDVAQE